MADAPHAPDPMGGTASASGGGTIDIHWMHAYRRATARELVDALRNGPTPAPASVPTNTRQLELELGIDLPHVYAYLGRTIEEFGSTVIAVPATASEDALISPFDTGGLAKHIAPICNWPKEHRNLYARDYTWPGVQLPEAFGGYPGTSPSLVDRYLDVTRTPIAAGPSSVWPERRSMPPTAPTSAEAPSPSILPDDIWHAPGAHWRNWTWEARWPTRIPCVELIGWSCAPSIYQQLVQIIETLTDVDIEFLMSRYVHGGVSVFLTHFAQRRSPT